MVVFTEVHTVMMPSFHYNFIRTSSFAFLIFKFMEEFEFHFVYLKFQKNFSVPFSKFKISEEFSVPLFCYTSFPFIIIYCSWRVDFYWTCCGPLSVLGENTTKVGLQGGHFGVTSKAFLHSLCLWWMAGINLVYLAGLRSKWLSSCRTCSAEGWMNWSPRPISRGELQEMTMTSFQWCDTTIQEGVLHVPLPVL